MQTMDTSTPKKVKSLTERFQNGEKVVIGEGYVFELERRGYLSIGSYIPTVVLEHPEVVRMLHEDFVRAGSDVVEAVTYFAHRSHLKMIGRENDLENLNRAALRIAREVADKYGVLKAGGICNTLLFKPGDSHAESRIEAIFKEQVEWAAEEGMDFMIGETFFDYGEAKIALECIKKHGKGMPAVITLSASPTGETFDGVELAEACRRLEDAGAAVVGLNCTRGPDSMLPVIADVRAKCKGPVACLPVTYRTDYECKAMQQLRDIKTGELSCPLELDPWMVSRQSIRDFTKQISDLGVQYMGLCCGARPNYIREMAETLGRRPPSSFYSPDMSKHATKIGDATDYTWSSEQYRKQMQS